MLIEEKKMRIRMTIKHLVGNMRSFIKFWIDKTQCQAAKPKKVIHLRY